MATANERVNISIMMDFIGTIGNICDDENVSKEMREKAHKIFSFNTRVKEFCKEHYADETYRTEKRFEICLKAFDRMTKNLESRKIFDNFLHNEFDLKNITVKDLDVIISAIDFDFEYIDFYFE